MSGYHLIKRLFDILGALLALIVLAPVIVAVGFMVLLFLGAPVFFTQERVTKAERVFRLWKFRSMLNVDLERGIVSDSQRLTRFGRILRSSSLDELPSLWNVLRGDMSLIGPRPLPTRYLPVYSAQQRRRHEVRGGLSGMAQVNGRNRVRWDDKFDLDVEYVDSMSFSLDLRILMRTIRIVLRADGISQEGEATAEYFGGTLKSDLLVFKERVRTATITSWEVNSTTGHAIGRCEMSSLSAKAFLIRFDDWTEATPDIEIRREVVRLLTNRTRATDADFAVCALSADSVDRAILTEAGFHEIVDPDQQLALGHVHAADQILSACRLWPDETADSDWISLISAARVQAEAHREAPAVQDTPRVDAGQ